MAIVRHRAPQEGEFRQLVQLLDLRNQAVAVTKKVRVSIMTCISGGSVYGGSSNLFADVLAQSPRLFKMTSSDILAKVSGLPGKAYDRIAQDPKSAAVAGALGLASIAAGYYLLRPSWRSPFDGPSSDQFFKLMEASNEYEQFRFLDNILKEYGTKNGTASFRLLGETLHITTDLELVRTVFGKEEMDTFHRSRRFKRLFTDLTKTALFVTDGELWKKHRTILTRAFSPKHIRYGNQVMIEKCERVFNSWGDNPILLYDQISAQITMDVACTVLFSHDPMSAEGKNDEFSNFATTVTSAFPTRFATPKILWPLMIPQYSERAMKPTMEAFFQMMSTILKGKQEARNVGKAAETHDMLDIILNLQGTEGMDLSQQEISDQIVG